MTKRFVVAFVVGAAAMAVLGLELAACSTPYEAADAQDAEDGTASSIDAMNPDDGNADAADAHDASPPFAITKLIPVLTTGTPYSIEALEVTNTQFRNFKASYGLEAGMPWAKSRKDGALRRDHGRTDRRRLGDELARRRMDARVRGAVG